jgi:predicted nucleic acid-binding protein
LTLVIDASIAAQWFLDEPGSAAASRLLLESQTLAAPDLILLEVGSVLSRAVRSEALPQDLAQEALDGLPRHLALYPIADLAQEAFAGSARFGGSIYDFCYIALGRRLKAKVVSNDKELVKIARKAGVEAERIGG